jgi:predicted Zn-dependent protease with MMP-like domain
MNRERFEELVARAVEDLPEEFREQMENVDVVVEDYPSREQLRYTHTEKDTILLGLYEGISLPERTIYYGLVTPDKISIFQKNIEAVCANDEEIVQQIGETVRHEIAHHFGIGDAKLEDIERNRKKTQL